MNLRTHRFRSCSSAAAFALVALVAWAPSTLQAQSSKKGLTSKLYVASMTGESQINRGEKIEAMNTKSAYNAEGSIIETKANSTNALVFSNGTGLALDSETRVEIGKFSQNPFTANRNDLEVEPSTSQTDALLARGTVSLCTSKLVAGSSMRYRTQLASVMIQGGKLVIESEGELTRISMLEGDSLIRGGALDLGGQVLHAGQQAVIRPGPARAPNLITINPIPTEERTRLDEHLYLACAARKTVFFDTRDTGPDTEIVPVPVVPASLPTPITVSPSRLPSGG